VASTGGQAFARIPSGTNGKRINDVLADWIHGAQIQPVRSRRRHSSAATMLRARETAQLGAAAILGSPLD